MAVTHTGEESLRLLDYLLIAREATSVEITDTAKSLEPLDDTVENKGTIATPSWCRFLIPPISFRVQWRTTFPGFLS